MEKITFTCETITPMFLAGADGQTPELRAPSIKGTLRFWWRAMNGHLGLHELKAKEDEIFGGTENRSNVILTTSFTEVTMNTENVPKFNYLRDFKSDKNGIKYLNVVFYFHSKKREAFATGLKFDVVLRSKKKDLLIEASNAFWLMSILGSLGTRCRRGNGAFSITKISKKANSISFSDLPFCYKNEDGKIEIGNLISIRKLTDMNRVENETLFSTLKNADVFFSNTSGNTIFHTWHDALNDIAYKMMSIRDTKTRRNVDLDFEKFTQDDLDKKAAFGLPFGILNGGIVNLFTNEDARRASPIYITINKLGREYYWTVTFLEGKFMPDKAKINHYNRNGNEINSWSEENIELVNEFRNKLINDWESSDKILDDELEALSKGLEYQRPPTKIKSFKF